VSAVFVRYSFLPKETDRWLKKMIDGRQAVSVDVREF